MTRRLKILTVLLLVAVALGCVGTYLTVYREAMSRTIMITPVVTTAVITQIILNSSRASASIIIDKTRTFNNYLPRLDSDENGARVQLAREHQQPRSPMSLGHSVAFDVTTG